MKKFLVGALALMLSVTLIGCTSTKETSETEENDVIRSIVGLEEGVISSADGTVVVRLKGNPTTGYQWTCTGTSDDTFFEDLNLEGTYTSDQVEESDVVLDGVGGIYEFSFKVVKDGEVDVNFTYARSWEQTEFDEVQTLHITKDGSSITAELE